MMIVIEDHGVEIEDVDRVADNLAASSAIVCICCFALRCFYGRDTNFVKLNLLHKFSLVSYQKVSVVEQPYDGHLSR